MFLKVLFTGVKLLLKFEGGVTVHGVLSGESAMLHHDGVDYEVSRLSVSDHDVSVTMGDKASQAQVAFQEDGIQVLVGGMVYRLKQATASIQDGKVSGSAHLTAPMPGRVVSVLVAASDPAEAGQPLLILKP